eukprot:13166739-Alexandrium_andersonii.AAC.1
MCIRDRASGYCVPWTLSSPDSTHPCLLMQSFTLVSDPAVIVGFHRPGSLHPPGFTSGGVLPVSSPA